jgi:peptide/nickel transport system ATP-binding protein
MMQLKAEKIWFAYPKGDDILKNIDFSVHSKEVVGVLAPSGFGKSTLGKVLSGYLKPQKGTVSIEGLALENKGLNYNPVQLIFQHPEEAINPLWKMSQVLLETNPINHTLMAGLGIDPDWLNRWPTELSGGELQRFCVLRVLNPKTRFIIADEMTTMLDAITQAQIWDVVLKYAKEHGIGVVVISHSAALVDRICDRVVALNA